MGTLPVATSRARSDAVVVFYRRICYRGDRANGGSSGISLMYVSSLNWKKANVGHAADARKDESAYGKTEARVDSALVKRVTEALREANKEVRAFRPKNAG